MKKLMPEVSDAEWDVMNVLWRADGPLTAAEVVDQLGEAGGKRSPKTVKTFLSRLLTKGALAAEAVGNRYLYRPRVMKDECVRAKTRSFLNRVFAGSAGGMICQFVQQTKLSPAEIAELKRLLENKGN